MAAGRAAALLPALPEGGGEEPVPGHRLRSRWVPSALTALGQRAARRHRELPPPEPLWQEETPTAAAPSGRPVAVTP